MPAVVAFVVAAVAAVVDEDGDGSSDAGLYPVQHRAQQCRAAVTDTADDSANDDAVADWNAFSSGESSDRNSAESRDSSALRCPPDPCNAPSGVHEDKHRPISSLDQPDNEERNPQRWT